MIFVTSGFSVLCIFIIYIFFIIYDFHCLHIFIIYDFRNLYIFIIYNFRCLHIFIIISFHNLQLYNYITYILFILRYLRKVNLYRRQLVTLFWYGLSLAILLSRCKIYVHRDLYKNKKLVIFYCR